MTSVPGAALRILQVLEPSGGGSGRHFVDLCAALHQRGHHVQAAYSPLRAEQRFVDELTRLKLPAIHSVDMQRSPGASDLAAWRALNKIISLNGPFDILHGHSSKAGALVRLRLGARQGARIYTPHAFRTMDPNLGKNGQRIFGAIEHHFGRHMTEGLIAVSKDEQDHAAALGIPSALTHLVVNGCRMPGNGHRDRIRGQFGIAPDHLVFGFVGRLSAQKAPERLIGAFNAIAATMAKAELVMIGFGELAANIRSLIAASPYADRIHLDGTIPGADAIPAFDVVVMPSRYEAMSYVMLEAASAAKPLIVTAVGGATTVVDHGLNGLIVENSDDTKPLADAMATFSDADRLTAFQREATARRNNFSIEKMVDETEAVYRKVIR